MWPGPVSLAREPRITPCEYRPRPREALGVARAYGFSDIGAAEGAQDIDLQEAEGQRSEDPAANTVSKARTWHKFTNPILTQSPGSFLIARLLAALEMPRTQHVEM